MMCLKSPSGKVFRPNVRMRAWTESVRNWSRSRAVYSLMRSKKTSFKGVVRPASTFATIVESRLDLRNSRLTKARCPLHYGNGGNRKIAAPLDKLRAYGFAPKKLPRLLARNEPFVAWASCP